MRGFDLAVPENLKAYITAHRRPDGSLAPGVFRCLATCHLGQPGNQYQLHNRSITRRSRFGMAGEPNQRSSLQNRQGVGDFRLPLGLSLLSSHGSALKLLSELYGITIFRSAWMGNLASSLNLPWITGYGQVLDVKQVPYVALRNIKDRRLIPLGSGVLSVRTWWSESTSSPRLSLATCIEGLTMIKRRLLAAFPPHAKCSIVWGQRQTSMQSWFQR